MRAYPALVVRPAAPAGEFPDLLAATLDDFDVLALEDIEDGAAVRAFFAAGAVRDAAGAAVAQRFPEAAVEAVDVSDEDWAARSQAGLTAIRAGRLTIAPPWDVPDTGDTIVILPSTGFGTGHHATTRLCLQALQQASPAGASVLDVGTGSGVLALAAAKLGAGRVLGIDDDPDAISNALENVDLNAHAIPRERITITCASLQDPGTVPARAFDIVLANLTGAMLTRCAAALQSACAPGGRLIVSGLREEEEPAVRAALAGAVERRAVEEGWVCLVIR